MNRFLPLVLLAACVPDLSQALDTATTGQTVADGLILVDARSISTWVGFDLDVAELADPTGPDWDFAFRRFHLRSNGGVSGEGGVEAILVEGPFEDVTLDEVNSVPTEGWGADLPDDDADGIDEYAMETWYTYDYDTHLLSITPGVWVIRSSLGAFYKVGFVDYYSEAGTPAMVTFEAALLE